MWSHMLGKIDILVHKISLKKSEEKKKIKNLKVHCCFQSHLLDALGHYFKNQKSKINS